MLRKGKLRKPCIRCGKNFEPSSYTNKICKDCKGKNWLDELVEKQGQRRFVEDSDQFLK